jgi:hypothetical protein
MGYLYHRIVAMTRIEQIPGDLIRLHVLSPRVLVPSVGFDKEDNLRYLCPDHAASSSLRANLQKAAWCTFFLVYLAPIYPCGGLMLI